MRIFILPILVLAFSLPALADPWDDVLKQVDLTKSQVRIEPLEAKQVGGAEYKSPYFEIMNMEPLRIPFLVRTYRDLLFETAKDPFKIGISVMARTSIPLGIRRNLEADPLAGIAAGSAKPGALLASLEYLHRVAKKPLSPSERSAITQKEKSLSRPAASALAYMIASITHSIEWRDRGFSEVDRKTMKDVYVEMMKAPHSEDTEEDRAGLSQPLKRLLKQVDLSVVMVGGYDLVLAVQQSREKFAQVKETDRFEWSSPYGRIVLRGAKKDDVTDAKPFNLLIVDAGGNDTYLSGAASDVDHPVGIILDLAGDDKYLASKSIENVVEKKEKRDPGIAPSFAAGVFGYAILYDADGRDVYRSYRMTQARGEFGLGFLWDVNGNDEYECWVQCQGSAEFGLGLLFDGGGSDSYSAMQSAQGFAGPLGSGVLFDLGTDPDKYTAVSKPIDFPSQVDAKFNVSFSQGASLGVRADMRDGHGLAGGFAALIDGGGDNVFDAGFYAQGVAYWYGVGLLSVGAGNDRYRAGKYAEGAGVHFGVGILHDLGGNDSYSVEQELGIGHGHDYAVGFLLDEAGDDTYVAPALSLGCATAQGIGVFWDRKGNDSYESKFDVTLGCAGLRIETPSIRTMSRTLGIFVDSGGKNKFDAPKANLVGTIASRKWTRANTEIPKAPKRMQDRLMGVGLVVDAPEMDDPF